MELKNLLKDISVRYYKIKLRQTLDSILMITPALNWEKKEKTI